MVDKTQFPVTREAVTGKKIYQTEKLERQILQNLISLSPSFHSSLTLPQCPSPSINSVLKALPASSTCCWFLKSLPHVLVFCYSSTSGDQFLFTYFCITSHPKSEWLKIQQSFNLCLNMWVRNLGKAWLDYSSFPYGVVWGHLLFSWWLVFSRGSK